MCLTASGDVSQLVRLMCLSHMLARMKERIVTELLKGTKVSATHSCHNRGLPSRG
jgi:hypothetical protein